MKLNNTVSSVDVLDIDEFCLHDLKEMVVKLGYGVANLMYYHFLRPILGLDYGLHPLSVDVDVLEMAKYVKGNKIIVVYVEHGSTKGVHFGKRRYVEDYYSENQYAVSIKEDTAYPCTKETRSIRRGNPKLVTFEIYHDGCFTPTPSRSYVGGQVSSVDVLDIDEFCLHDLKEMVVKLGYGVANLMYYHFLRPILGLDYGLHPLNVDVDVLEMEKYVKGNKIIVVYVEHGSKIDSSPDVNRNLTYLCHMNLTKEWEQVSSKALSIGEVMKNLSKNQPASFVEGPIVKENVDPFDGLDELLEGVGPMGNFKEVEVDTLNVIEEESDTKQS
ncbi:hypothetical protein Tco_0607127 [Tanacetum coccineum]